ncbi:hypothetical protein BDZ89DRAFT_970727, partial [Hymenopellis radicata]
DDPMANWLPLRDLFVQEILRRESVGQSPACASCRAALQTTWSPDAEDSARPTTDSLIRCETCGDFSECVACSLLRHARMPLHVVKRFSRKGFWEKTTLMEMGTTVHIGHQGGLCPYPGPPKSITVMHTTGIHRLRASFCNCDVSDTASPWQLAMRDGWFPATTIQPQTFATVEVLKLFRLLNVISHVNVRNFVTALERKSNPHGTEWVPDRYKSFALMSRQWSYLQRLRRSGLGHTADGIAGAKWGSTAVRCWACPWEGVNLPEDWKNASPEERLRFLFMLFLALDANFRMRTRKKYVILADGLGYQVPTENYVEHIKNYVSEEDVNTCVGFAAIMQKDTRMSTGLRATGVGGCICARHELVRPLGIGDLMKGERYANMDYIFWASILYVTLLWILLSYDVGCQWRVNLLDRKPLLPEVLQHDESEGRPAPSVRVGLPVWHGGTHVEKCATEHSLRYKTGAAMTDGEGIERVWSRLNPKSMATKEMHQDGRHENLEEAIDAHNFDKCMGLGVLLDKRLEVSLEEYAVQIRCHAEATSSLEEGVEDDWTSSLHKWHAEEDWPTLERKAMNPYVSTWERGMSVLIKNDISGANYMRRNARKSATVFLTLGADIRWRQLRIMSMLKARAKLSAADTDKVQARRRTLLRSLQKFRELQAIHMPNVSELVLRADNPAGEPVLAENIKLWMPSDVPAEDRDSMVKPYLLRMETLLQREHCSSALLKMRLKLHAKNHIIRFRDKNVTGQKRSTRARTLIDRVSDQVDLFAAQYRCAQGALTSLVGSGGVGEFRVLTQEDISSKFVEDHNAKAARRLARISGRESRLRPAQADAEDADSYGAEARGGSRRKLSWIWTAAGTPDASTEEYLYESVRVEWCKSWARCQRWGEEVKLLKVEMERVSVTLLWLASQWRLRAEADLPGSEDLKAGRRSYALRQAHWLDAVREQFEARWKGSATRRAAAASATQSGEPPATTGGKRRHNQVA